MTFSFLVRQEAAPIAHAKTTAVFVAPRKEESAIGPLKMRAGTLMSKVHVIHSPYDLKSRSTPKVSPCNIGVRRALFAHKLMLDIAELAASCLRVADSGSVATAPFLDSDTVVA